MAQAPGITQWLPLPLGPLGQFVKDPLEFQRSARERFGDVFRFRMGPLLVHFVYHPDHVRQVLIDRSKNYQRGWQYHTLRRILGENLVVSEGEPWRRQRRLAQPAFQRGRLTKYAEVMAESTARLLTCWEQHAADGRAVEISDEMARLALDIAGRTLFDRDVSGEAASIGDGFATASGYLQLRFNRPFTTPPLWLPTPGSLRFRRVIRELKALVLKLVRERRAEGRDHGDLLSMLLQARDEETGEVMSDEQVRGEALAFLIAGHETSATALTWTWYLLGLYPAIQQRARQEIQQAVGDRRVTAADLAQMPLVQRILEESMRLYPPAWAAPRQAMADDELGGFTIPAGSTVVVSQFITHRHPAAWESPETFDPERFTPEGVEARPKGAYFPFLAGPHQCIGNEFAMLEMRLAMAMILQSFELSLATEQPIHPTANLVLRPSGPIAMRLRRVGRSTARKPDA